MSLRQLAELTFSQSGNSGPLAAWRRAISAAVDALNGGGGGGGSELVTYAFSKRNVPATDAAGVQPATYQVIGANTDVTDSLPQTFPATLVSIFDAYVPEGFWRIRECVLYYANPSGSVPNNWNIVDQESGNPLATLEDYSSGSAGITPFDLLGAEPFVGGRLIRATVECPASSEDPDRGVSALVTLILESVTPK